MRFQSQFDQYRYRNGQECEIVGTRHYESHPWESCDLLVVRFGDGEEIEAWHEELTPTPPEGKE